MSFTANESFGIDRLIALEAFAKAADLGSYSAAAEVLGVSAQWVGRHVQTLERRLGVRLIHRTTRRQHLTEVGRTFRERVRAILAEVEAAEALAAETRAVPSGRLRVNAPTTFGIHALSRRLPEYLRAHPAITVDLSFTNRQVDVIEEGFDVVFRVGELVDSGLVARALRPYELVLCAAASYLSTRAPPRSPADLSAHECLGFTHPTLLTQWVLEGPEGRMNVPIASRITADSGEALLALARAGMGLLFQPRELVEADLASGDLVPVLPQYTAPTRPLSLVYAPDRRMTPKLRSFVEWAQSAFGTIGT